MLLLAVALAMTTASFGADRNGPPGRAADDARKAKERERDQRRVEKERERHDLDGDGKVDAMEAEAAKNPWYRERGLKLDRPWESHADGDADGKLSAAELYAFKKEMLDDDQDGVLSSDDYRRFFKRVRSLVQTPREKRFDRNGDGFLDGDEIPAMLKDRLSSLKGVPKRPVESKFDRLFDSNVDGNLSSDEAGALELAIGQ
jgi:hypothetical protein